MTAAAAAVATVALLFHRLVVDEELVQVVVRFAPLIDALAAGPELPTNRNLLDDFRCVLYPNHPKSPDNNPRFEAVYTSGQTLRLLQN